MTQRMQIQQQYDVDYDDDFWKKKYGKKYGYEILAENTLESLKYIHAVYDLAVENGYVDDGSYEGLKKRLEQENNTRKEKLAKNDVIYGLKEYSYDLYLQYEMSSIKEQYCNDKTREGMDLTEEEIVEHYNSGIGFLVRMPRKRIWRLHVSQSYENSAKKNTTLSSKKMLRIHRCLGIWSL